MKFRPCIDIHNGRVKQIVGGSLADAGSSASENFVSELGADFYARLYREKGITGGHIIMLNPAGSEYYDDDLRQAFSALEAYPGGLQIGGGINEKNAPAFLERGASHVIVTSYVFRDGEVNMDNLKRLCAVTGRSRLVIDLSCRRREDGCYYIVTDRWQRFTRVRLDISALEMFSEYCGEFLVHAVDAEGKARGIEEPVVKLLGEFGRIPVTYAGGIGSYADIELLKTLGRGRTDFTVGSALDIFGGSLDFDKICAFRGKR